MLLLAALAYNGQRVGALSELLAEEVSKASRGHAPLFPFDLSIPRGAFETSLLSSPDKARPLAMPALAATATRVTPARIKRRFGERPMRPCGISVRRRVV